MSSPYVTLHSMSQTKAQTCLHHTLLCTQCLRQKPKLVFTVRCSTLSILDKIPPCLHRTLLCTQCHRQTFQHVFIVHYSALSILDKIQPCPHRTLLCTQCIREKSKHVFTIRYSALSVLDKSPIMSSPYVTLHLVFQTKAQTCLHRTLLCTQCLRQKSQLVFTVHYSALSVLDKSPSMSSPYGTLHSVSQIKVLSCLHRTLYSVSQTRVPSCLHRTLLCTQCLRQKSYHVVTVHYSALSVLDKSPNMSSPYVALLSVSQYIIK